MANFGQINILEPPNPKFGLQNLRGYLGIFTNAGHLPRHVWDPQTRKFGLQSLRAFVGISPNFVDF